MERASASALTRRAPDSEGDAHERFLLRFELARLGDNLGDFEEARIRRAFLSGRKATLGAQIARAQDPAGDAQQQDLDLRSRRRRYAAIARLRDFAGDKRELDVWRRDYVRHGPSHTGAIMIAKQREDREARRRAEREKELRQATRHEQSVSREEEREERDIQRSEDRPREDEREEEREEEDLEDGGERAEEREGEREEEREEEKAIQQSEGDPEE